MTVDVRLRPEAEQDLVEAALWYEANEPTLGAKFLDQVHGTLVTIAEQPVAYPVIYKSVRRALVKRFAHILAPLFFPLFLSVHPKLQQCNPWVDTSATHAARNPLSSRLPSVSG